MQRRRLPFSLALFFGFLMAPQLVAGADAPKRPNFVIINIDDLGYADIGPYGSKLNRTPHLDRMAKEGRKLTCYYAAPVCSPSRSSLMTGCLPVRVGVPQVLFPGNDTGINASEHTLAELLRGLGYATFCIGKWHLGDQTAFLPTRHGFDHYFGLPYSNDMGPAEEGARSNFGEAIKLPKKEGVKGHPPLPLLRDETVVERVRGNEQTTLTTRYTDEAVRFLRQRHDRPFLLYVAHTAVHFPLYPSPEFRGKSKNGLYGDWVEEIDASVGRILDAVRELQPDGQTLVLFTSDNGGTPRAVNAPLRGFKASTWEGGMREPTIVWWPGQIPAGTATDEITGMIDVLPTFVRRAGGQVPADRVIDGKDAWPLYSGQPGAKSEHVYFPYFLGRKLNAVREGPWKFDLVNGKLYNLATDIGESTDVAAANPDVVQRLRALAGRIAADLGDGKAGPGCRPPGQVSGAQPILDREGRVRSDLPGNVRRFD